MKKLKQKFELCKSRQAQFCNTNFPVLNKSGVQLILFSLFTETAGLLPARYFEQRYKTDYEVRENLFEHQKKLSQKPNWNINSIEDGYQADQPYVDHSADHFQTKPNEYAISIFCSLFRPDFVVCTNKRELEVSYRELGTLKKTDRCRLLLFVAGFLTALIKSLARLRAHKKPIKTKSQEVQTGHLSYCKK